MEYPFPAHIDSVAVNLLAVNSDGLFLAVSRKTDHTDMGLPGGKVDPEDGLDYEAAIARELREETGLQIVPGTLEPFFARWHAGKLDVTYSAQVFGRMETKEAGVVRWVERAELVNGKTFGRYNALWADSKRLSLPQPSTGVA